MDTIIDLKDASKALDLSNIRFQLMCATTPLALKMKRNTNEEVFQTVG